MLRMVVVQAIKTSRVRRSVRKTYGPIFLLPKDDRQKRLEKQYWFKCACVACKENWPLMHEMTQDVLNFRCGECSGFAPSTPAPTCPS